MTGSLFSFIVAIRELKIGVDATVSCTVGATTRIEKNGSRIIGVGACTRFSSRLIFHATMLRLTIMSSKKAVCLVSTNLYVYQDNRSNNLLTYLDSQ
jgi:hypothetical protein